MTSYRASCEIGHSIIDAEQKNKIGGIDGNRYLRSTVECLLVDPTVVLRLLRRVGSKGSRITEPHTKQISVWSVETRFNGRKFLAYWERILTSLP